MEPVQARSRWTRKVLAVAAGLGLALGLGEAVLRASGRGERVTRPLASNIISAHPTRIFGLTPQYRAHSEHGGRYANRAWPFRGRPPADPSLGLERIAFFGDSNVFGDGVDSSATMPFLVELELERLGCDRSAFQVVNYGVPGYSTVQVAQSLAEVMVSDVAPQHVVIYTGAWNDLGPAIRFSDMRLMELQRFQDTWLGRSAITRMLAQLGDRYESMPYPQLVALWKEGRLPNGRKVPPADQLDALERIAALCAAQGASLWVLGPTQPQSAIDEIPVTREDAARIAQWAAEACDRSPTVHWLDVHELFRSSGLDDEQLFVDIIHPSPDGHAAIAAALAPRLASVLKCAGGRPASSRPPEPAELMVAPARVSAFGDVELRFEGLAERLGTNPDIQLGGAPLLEVRVHGADVLGMAPADAPGLHSILIQSRAGVEVYPGAIERIAPTLRVEEDGDGRRIVLSSRPGDHGRILLSLARRGSPDWQRVGAYGLDPDPNGPPIAIDLVCDASGRATHVLQPLSTDAFAQALVLPRGIPADDPDGAARWTPVIQL